MERKRLKGRDSIDQCSSSYRLFPLQFHVRRADGQEDHRQGQGDVWQLWVQLLRNPAVQKEQWVLTLFDVMSLLSSVCNSVKNNMTLCPHVVVMRLVKVSNISKLCSQVVSAALEWPKTQKAILQAWSSHFTSLCIWLALCQGRAATNIPLIDWSMNKKWLVNYFDYRLIVSVIFQVKMSNICRFQLPQCSDLLPFFWHSWK